MVRNIDDLALSSRVWIYQSDRPLNSEEQTSIIETSRNFLAQWAAHGQDLTAAAEIRNEHFLIIAADEDFNAASGCSIDAQFRFVQEIGNQNTIDFFKRSNLAFLKNERVELIDMKALKTSISEGKIDSGDTFFDNTVKTLAELNEKWQVNANESWIKRYFPATETV